MKRILILYVILCVFLLLAACSTDTITVIEDLSVASPIDTVDVQGSSYVKIISDTTETEKEPTAEDMEGLDKKVYREGDLVAFDPIGVDPDGDIITYEYSRPLDENGEWQTEIGDAGTYLVKITATDGKEEVEKKVVLLILSANRAPNIEGLEDMTVAEGDLVKLNPKVFDYNSDEVTVTYSKPFNENGEWQTSYDDAGTYIVKVTASDNLTSSEIQVTIVVEDTNRAPVIDDIEPITAFAGDLITVNAYASDEDNDNVTITFSSLVSNDGTWQTTEEDEGTYTLKVTATDGKTKTTQDVEIILNHKNKAPVISLDAVTAQETELVVLQPTIVDPEGDEFTVTYSEPFDSNGQWQTDYDSAGEYTITITAKDSNGDTSSIDVLVSISDKNRAPVFKI